MGCSTLGFPVLHYRPEFAQTHVHWVDDAIQPSHSLSPTSPAQSFPASESLPVSQLFKLSGQSIGASASASVLPMNIQDWFPIGLIGLISLLPKGLSRIFSSITGGKHQFFGTQPSLWSNPYMTTGKTIALTIQTSVVLDILSANILERELYNIHILKSLKFERP